MAAPIRSKKDRSEDLKRLAVAAIGIPIALLCVFADGVPFLLLIGIFSYFAILEYSKIVFDGNRWSRTLILLMTCMSYILAGYANRADLVSVILLASLAMAGFIEFRTAELSGALARISKTAIGPVYIGLTLSNVLMIRDNYSNGVYLIVFILTITWMTDSSAYFVGRKFGRHKLSPVSPKKSIEGALGGLLGANLLGLVYLNLLDYSVWQIIFLASAVSVSAQLGDLFESLIKRDAGVKDSSNLIPGHGGVLDRIDSLLFSIPAAYFVLRFFR